MHFFLFALRIWRFPPIISIISVLYSSSTSATDPKAERQSVFFKISSAGVAMVWAQLPLALSHNADVQPCWADQQLIDTLSLHPDSSLHHYQLQQVAMITSRVLSVVIIPTDSPLSHVCFSCSYLDVWHTSLWRVWRFPWDLRTRVDLGERIQCAHR